MRSVPLLLVVVPIACMFDSSSDPVPTRPSDPPPSKLVLPRGGDGPPVVTMSYCPTPGCTLVFDFAAPLPDAKLVFEPAQPGTQSWRTPTQLVFEPAKGALLAGHEIVLTIPTAGFTSSLTVPFFEAAGKVARWPVQPGKPRLVAFLNGFSAQIGRGPLFALFDQPVDPAAIARSARVKSGGARIPVTIRRPASTTQIYDRPIELANLVTLELDRLPEDGDTVSIELPSNDDTGTGAPATTELVVNTTLTGGSVAEVNDDGTSKGRRTPLNAEWSIPFSNQVTAKAFETHVSIEPKPKAMSTRVWGVRGQVDAQLEPGVVYKLVVDESLRDVLGNRLRAPVVASFRSQDAKPSLAMPTNGLVLEAGRAHLPVRMMNAGTMKLTTQKFATVAAFLAARSAGTACTGNETEIDASGALNQLVTRELPLDPGLYCVAMSGKGRGSEGKAVELAAATFTQVSALGITAKVYDEHVFAWVTRLADGRPVADTKATLVDDAGSELATGKTAADGTVTFDKVTVASRAGLTAHAQIVVGDGQLVASLADDELSNARQFDLDGKIRDAEPLVASLFTERGVYRPGEAVHVKALVRDPETYRAKSGEITLAVTDARGEQVISKAVTLDKFGGATLELPLKEDAKVGAYTVHATMGDRSSVRTFHVEEYRVPTFAVTVGTDEPWTPGSPTHAAISASYLHGGPLAGRELSWEITRMPETFVPAGFANFVFADMATVPRTSESLTHGAGKLDGQGHFVVALTPDHGSKAGPMRYTVDASVTDVDRQVYAGKLSKVIHPADIYVGMAPPTRRVATAGDTVELPIAAVTPEGVAKAGIDVTVSLERVDYHGVTRLGEDGTQRIVHPVATSVARCAVTTKATPVTCKLPIAAAGEYVVRASGEDAKHRKVEAAFAMSASGRTPVAWPRFDHERIQIVADKASYRPGDVARLVVQSPFPEARGLLTIERDGVIDHKVFVISGDTPELRVPITDAAVPNVYASVVILRGRVHDAKDATGFETGAPAFRLGYVQLKVEPTTHKLDVAVTPASPKAYPGGTLGVDIKVKDANGTGRSGQATVMVVDEAVLGMTRYRTPDPLADLFAPRALAVRTGESRLDMLNARRSRREQVFPAGDGGEMAMAGGDAAPTPELPSDLRKLFSSTAYFNPDVTIGDDGKAHLEIKLPDNVTTYRIMAVVVDGEARAGSGQGSVLARKPLIVQPVLPRFVHPGDHLRLEARVFNGTEEKGQVEITQTLSGIRLDGGTPKQTAETAANGEAKVSYAVVIPDDAHGEAQVAFSATLGSFHDAVEIKLPIVDPGSSRKLVVEKVVTGNDKLVVPLPDDRRAGTVKIEVVASTTALSELKDAVQYLMTYPNGCIEQTTSTAYPLVVLRDLLPSMGITVDSAELDKFSQAGVKRILSFQTTAGGLSYWPGGTEPHAFATAFGLTALIEAKKKGYDVPDAALAKMADYLESSLRQGTITGEMPHGGMADADTRAFFVMTLGRLGRPQPAYVSTLWEKRAQLTPFGIGFLAIAVSEGSGDKSLLQPMLDAVHAAAKEDTTQAYYEGDRSAGWSMGSPLRAHATALLAYADAGTDGGLAGKLLTGLLARRQGGMWGNTQENVFGIMAVAKLTKSSSDKPTLTVKVNGKAIDASQLHDAAGGAKKLELAGSEFDTGKELAVEIGNGGKPVYATVRVEYISKLEGKARAAQSAGFDVKRTYETIDGASLEGKHVKLGSLVRVRVKVHAAKANHYVAIDDKLPAGLEPLNAALATTETVAAGKISPEAKRAATALSYSELRDSRVAFYIDDMGVGDYELVYVARATTPGSFIRPAASAEAMYAPEIHGSSTIDDIVVE